MRFFYLFLPFCVCRWNGIHKYPFVIIETDEDSDFYSRFHFYSIFIFLTKDEMILFFAFFSINNKLH